MSNAVATPIRSSPPTRAFGRYTLRGVIGRSDATVLWLAVDTRTSTETMLTMPRVPPSGSAAVGAWLLAARRAARLDHPSIAATAECGVHEHWPYVAVDRGAGVTLDEWLRDHPHPGVDEATGWLCAVLRGLAFAHDAGVAHHDLQLHNIIVNERGQTSVMALGVAAGTGHADGVASTLRKADAKAVALEPETLRAQRAAAERDVLACGLVLHRLLAGSAALGIGDITKSIERMAPIGREIVRLPWTLPQAIPEALRAIANRSTSGQPRLRYRNARTFFGALNGWREAQAEDQGGPVAQMLDRMQRVGHLPALPDLGRRVLRLTSVGRSRTDEIAQLLLPDLALSFELLRTLNSARVQGTQIAGNGAVLTLRRVVHLIGVNGVRAAANRLRPWPGALDEPSARRLGAAVERVRFAGHLAQALRPAGYDAEVAYLVTALQCLSRLLLAYHFADEAEQIRQLVQPAPGPRRDAETSGGEQPGLSIEAAAFAVLGVDVEAFGHAVARHWGLGDEILHMMRRLPTDAAVRKPDDDAEMLRIVASAAIETVDALDGPAARVPAAIDHIAARFGSVLQLTPRGLKDALQEARDALAQGRSPASSRKGSAEER